MIIIQDPRRRLTAAQLASALMPDFQGHVPAHADRAGCGYPRTGFQRDRKVSVGTNATTPLLPRDSPRPDGSPAPDGPFVEAIEDKLELIAAGQAVAIIPAGVRTASPRPDLTTVPLYGVEPSHVVLATRAGDRSRLVAAFRKSAQALLTGPG
jgi:hypothetical protein